MRTEKKSFLLAVSALELLRVLKSTRKFWWEVEKCNEHEGWNIKKFCGGENWEWRHKKKYQLFKNNRIYNMKSSFWFS